MKAILRINAFVIVFLAIPVSALPNTERNLLSVYIDSYDRIFVEQELMDIEDLKDAVKSFITNPNDAPEKAEREEIDIALFGKVMVSKGLISIQCERNTTYGFYVKVQNELEKAFNELRNEFAIAHFNINYKKLSKSKQKAVDNVIPKSISEAEPNFVRNEKGELVRNKPYWYCF